MWKPFLVMLAVIAIVLICIAAAPSGVFVPGIHRPEPTATAFVRVDIGGGHGSAVHIGHGYYLTAGHVATAAKGGKLVLVNSEGGKTPAEVLWSNNTYDLALLRAAPDFASSAPLSCRVPDTGEAITAHGNPETVSFVGARGYIAGGIRQMAHWRAVYIVDMTVVPGMSGGGVTDQSGSVVGITVGVQVAGFGITGFGMIVPGATACLLMDRAG